MTRPVLIEMLAAAALLGLLAVLALAQAVASTSATLDRLDGQRDVQQRQVRDALDGG